MVDLRNHRTNGLPLVAGFVNGLLTYVAAFLGTLGLFAVLGLKPLVGLAFAMAGGGQFSFFDMVGFVFYGGHLVPVSGPDGSVNFALALASSGFVYVVLVALTIGLTGYYLGSAEWVGTSPLGFVVGAHIVLGYFPLAVIGSQLFSVTVTQQQVLEEGTTTMAFALPTVEAIALAGVLFPVVFGGLGGAIAAQT